MVLSVNIGSLSPVDYNLLSIIGMIMLELQFFKEYQQKLSSEMLHSLLSDLGNLGIVINVAIEELAQVHLLNHY